MGLGKTATALSLAIEYQKKRDTCITILCPAHLIHTYHHEAQIHFGVEVLHARIVSYDALTSIDLLKKGCTVICDEAHRILHHPLKDNLAHFLRHDAFKVLFLTGTPIHQHIQEIAYYVNICAQKNVVPINTMRFRAMYFSPKTGSSLVWGYITGIFTSAWTSKTLGLGLFAYTALGLRIQKTLSDVLSLPWIEERLGRLGFKNMDDHISIQSLIVLTEVLSRLEPMMAHTLKTDSKYPSSVKIILYEGYAALNGTVQQSIKWGARQSLFYLLFRLVFFRTPFTLKDGLPSQQFVMRLFTVMFQKLHTIASHLPQRLKYLVGPLSVHLAQRMTSLIYTIVSKPLPLLIGAVNQAFPVSRMFQLHELSMSQMTIRDIIDNVAVEYLPRVIKGNLSVLSRMAYSMVVFIIFSMATAVLRHIHAIASSRYLDDFYRDLNVSRLARAIHPYIDVVTTTPETASIRIETHIVHVPYTAQQAQLWTRFVHNALTIADMNDLDIPFNGFDIPDMTDETYLKHGRMMSNACHAVPPKFLFCYHRMCDNSQKSPRSCVVYTDFSKTLESFAEFLESKHVKYGIVRNSTDLVLEEFARGDIDVLLLAPGLTEGITIRKVQQMHILDPVETYMMYAQLMYRVIRLNSHQGVQNPYVTYYTYIGVLSPSLLEFITKFMTHAARHIDVKTAMFRETIRLWKQSEVWQSRLPLFYEATIRQTVTPEAITFMKLAPTGKHVTALFDQLQHITSEPHVTCCASFDHLCDTKLPACTLRS